MRQRSRAFTLVEVAVVMPIVILSIAAVLAVVINISGSVMSAREQNASIYDVQRALDSIERDVRQSVAFLAASDISVSSTRQGTGPTGVLDFKNIDSSGSHSLILKSFATSSNPVSISSRPLYMAGQPTACSGDYLNNTPMFTNIVYYVQNGSLWKRTLLPSYYQSSSMRCGGTPWQIPSCYPGTYDGTHFCKIDDVKVIDNISTGSGFAIRYHENPASEDSLAVAIDPSKSDAERGNVISAASSVSVSIAVDKNIYGKRLGHSSTMRISRSGAAIKSVGDYEDISAAVPTLNALAVVDGSDINVSWPEVGGASYYTLQYRMGSGGPWMNAQTSSGDTVFSNSSRSSKITDSYNGVSVQVRLRAYNDRYMSLYGTSSVSIPLWVDLPLINGWTSYGSAFGLPRYTITGSGMVLFAGLVANSSLSNADISGALPEKYRPAHVHIYSTKQSGSSGVHARIDVNALGGVKGVDLTSAAWVSLDTVRYLSASKANFTSMSLGSSFGTYASHQGNNDFGADVSYAEDSVGRVYTQGLVRHTASTSLPSSGALMFQVPVSSLRVKDHRYHSVASCNLATISMRINSQVTYISGGCNSYIPVNLNYLPNRSGSKHETGWLTPALQAGWGQYSNPSTPTAVFSEVRYKKAADGVVEVKGMISGGTVTAGTTLFTLPAGYRPDSQLLFRAANAGSGANNSRVDVMPDGKVILRQSPGTSASTWLSLDGITFVAP